MNHPVLLADDSLTIQKVIKITLASQPYAITDCSSEDELFQQLPIVQPKIVFLDFNLSERYTGYELTTKIKSILPSAKVLLLLGTFDNVDDAAMEKCGASDKIVKPFDSNKFIAICKQLIETFATDDIPYPEAKKETPLKLEDPDDQWTLSHTTEQSFPVEDKPLDNSIPNLNALDLEISDWGMNVPGIISGGTTDEILLDLPPVIGTKAKAPVAPAAVTPKLAAVPSIVETKPEPKPEPKLDPKFDVKFPETSDLDYPSVESFNEVTFEDTPSNVIHLETDSTPIEELEAQIRDEVEENLWQADEFEDLKKEVSSKMEEVKSSFQPTRETFDDSLFKPIEEIDINQWQDSSELFKTPEKTNTDLVNPLAHDVMKMEMEALVKKYVKEYMDEMFKQNVEKVSWEVIPDLAENLIRQELGKISQKIMNEQK